MIRWQNGVKVALIVTMCNVMICFRIRNIEQTVGLDFRHYHTCEKIEFQPDVEIGLLNIVLEDK